MFRAFSKFMFWLTGWREENHVPKDLKKFIVVVAPHTSNWDFLVGLLARSIWRLTEVKYLAKKSLFKWPYGAWFKALGGYPVDRSKSTNMVDQVVELFNAHERFAIAITPEGTRSYQPKWKTGFYHIAQKAQIPIILGTMDYEKKLVRLSPPFYTTGDKEKDLEWMKDQFRKVKGRNPEDGVR